MKVAITSLAAQGHYLTSHLLDYKLRTFELSEFVTDYLFAFR